MARGNKDGHRRFGLIRKLPSGRFQATYLGPDGQRRPAPKTYESKRDAEQFLVRVESAMMSDEWTDPLRARVPLGDYAERWITERAGLRPRTVQLYRWLWSKHVGPYLGAAQLGQLSAATVREWRSDRLEAGVSQSVTAKAYRLLRAVLATAVEEDRILTRNPCRVKGADRESPPERPVLTVAQLYQLADAMRFRRFRVLILLTAFATLRWGEVTALRRCDIAPDGTWVRVSFAHTEVTGRGIVVGPPKSRAGVRTVAVPAPVATEVVKHLAAYVDARPDALVFTGPKDHAALRRGSFSNLVRWVPTVAELGMAGLHFHDLRHAGNVWAAQTGVSTKDLMARMGHDDMRAALIYQRATSEADRRIADQLGALVERHHREGDDDDDGLAAALVPA
ncbi:MAG: site-specific integrase [Actinomycetota bacterium]|nr:site-specific integrase [Actinomycetota bacterium]